MTWTSDYLAQQWPDLESIPEGRDVFSAYPIYYPSGDNMTPRKVSVTQAHNGTWIVTVQVDGATAYTPFKTQAEAVIYADKKRREVGK